LTSHYQINLQQTLNGRNGLTVVLGLAEASPKVCAGHPHSRRRKLAKKSGSSSPNGWRNSLKRDNVVGIRHLMIRDPKTGKFERITGDAKQIDKALKSKNACWIYTKDPNVQAFTDLMNWCLDKPAEHVQVAGADGGPLVIRWQRDEQQHWSPPPVLLRSKPVIPTTKKPQVRLGLDTTVRPVS